MKLRRAGAATVRQAQQKSELRGVRFLAMPSGSNGWFKRAARSDQHAIDDHARCASKPDWRPNRPQTTGSRGCSELHDEPQSWRGCDPAASTSGEGSKPARGCKPVPERGSTRGPERARGSKPVPVPVQAPERKRAREPGSKPAREPGSKPAAGSKCSSSRTSPTGSPRRRPRR